MKTNAGSAYAVFIYTALKNMRKNVFRNLI